jgi:hypothetical protein
LQKMLPVSYPAVTTYTWHSIQLSIVSSYPICHPWIYSNFIHLGTNEGFKGEKTNFDFVKFDYFYYDLNPWLRRTTEKISYGNLSRILSISNKTLSEYIKEMLDMNHYVSLYLNDYYLPNTIFYQNGHVIHEVLIYGYDDEKELFYTGGIFDTRKYRFSTNRYCEIEEAFYHVNPLDHVKGYDLSFYTYRINDRENYPFILSNVIEAIDDYINSRDIMKRFSMLRIPEIGKNVYGMGVYKVLKQYLQGLYDDKEGYKPDRRPFQILHDHKKFMVERLLYLKEEGLLGNESLIVQFEALAKKIEIIRNIFLKYLIYKDKEDIDKLFPLIDEVVDTETSLLNSLLSDLTNILKNRSDGRGGVFSC